MINRVVIVGRLTRDPELRTTPTGVSVISFSLAFDNKTRNADGSTGSSFINCTAWRQNAEFIAKYCQKGTQVGIEGSLFESRFQRRDGTNASRIEIQVDSVTLFGSKNPSTSQAQENAANNAYVQDSEPDDEDLLGGENFADEDVPF